MLITIGISCQLEGLTLSMFLVNQWSRVFVILKKVFIELNFGLFRRFPIGRIEREVEWQIFE